MGFEIKDGVLVRYKEELGITSVTIPDSVTSIGSGAFDGTAWYNAKPDGVVYAGKVAYKYKGEKSSVTKIVLKDGTKGIADYAFSGCSNLTSVTIPDSVTKIGWHAFEGYNSLKSKQANYKAFDIIDNDIRCMGYTFKPNEWTEEISKIKLCEKGYHFCTNLFEIFNYYFGTIDKDIAIYECEIGEKIIRGNKGSKCVTNKIKPVKRLYQKDVMRILNCKEGEPGE